MLALLLLATAAAASPAAGRDLLEMLSSSADEESSNALGYAFTDFTDLDAMADAFVKTKSAAFDYTLNVSNSIAQAVRQGHGRDAADAMRLACEKSEWDPALVYPLSGIFRKAFLDNLLLGVAPGETLATIQYMAVELPREDDPQKPFGGAPATYAFAIPYLADRGADEQAGELLALVAGQAGVTLHTCLEAVAVAVLDQGCAYAFPLLQGNVCAQRALNLLIAQDVRLPAAAGSAECMCVLCGK